MVVIVTSFEVKLCEQTHYLMDAESASPGPG